MSLTEWNLNMIYLGIQNYFVIHYSGSGPAYLLSGSGLMHQAISYYAKC
jgi:hypothetical protein